MGSDGPTIRFLFDYISTNAYLAWLVLPELARRHRAGRQVEHPEGGDGVEPVERGAACSQRQDDRQRRRGSDVPDRRAAPIHAAPLDAAAGCRQTSTAHSAKAASSAAPLTDASAMIPGPVPDSESPIDSRNERDMT